MAFLFCEFMAATDFAGLLNYTEMQFQMSGESEGISFEAFYGFIFYLATMLCWLFFAGIKIHSSASKSLLFWCATMLIFLLLMAVDSLVNGDAETYIWRNYENIILCIHVGITLSLYRPSTITYSMVAKLRLLFDLMRNGYAYTYFCYTVWHGRQETN